MKNLTPGEIQHIKSLRAEALSAKAISMPASPVDMPVCELGVTRRKPCGNPLDIMAARCFTAELNASDLRFMALAILQLQDQLFEARERIKQLEGGVK